jgi:UDP-glucose 4-epimerase
MPRKFLITGGEGFIGRNIKNYIISKWDAAYTLDISGDPDYRVSVTDFDGLVEIKEDFDGVFHLAAVTSPPQFEDNPLVGFKVNANGTLNVLEFARQRNIKRVVLASSSATYGNARIMSTEGDFPKSYANIYPITTMVDGYLARYYSYRKGMECISLRYFNTYGPGENTKSQYASVGWRFFKTLSRGEGGDIRGRGAERGLHIRPGYSKGIVSCHASWQIRGNPTISERA